VVTIRGTIGLALMAASFGPSAVTVAKAAPAAPHAGVQLAQFARPVGDERLEALANRYFRQEWRDDPVRATLAGVHDYDDKLGSYSADAYAERLASAKGYLTELRAIDAGTMGAEASYDAQILESHLESSVLTLGTLERWRHQPGAYAAMAATAIYALLSRDFAPLPVRVRAAVARERQIPGLLDAARTNTTTVDSVTSQLARVEVAGTIAYFSNAVPAAVVALKDAGLRAQFKDANDAAIVALRGYLTALESGPFAHPSGTFAIGPERFAEMLRLQELEPMSLRSYERVGVAALEQTKAEFADTAKRIDAARSPKAVAASLGAEHPAPGGLLAKASADIVALRAFVIAHHILTLPPDDDVTVIASPPFSRETMLASMDLPGPLETHATGAFYNVTPAEPDWSPARKEQYLALFNNAAFPIVSMHEVVPGHYVNFALQRHEKLSMIRRLLPSVSFAEGWAHYDEQMMVDEGWGNGDPRVRLAQLQAALQRECRYIVGLREHTQGMSVAAATTFFEDNAYLAEEPARREALRGTGDPLYGYYTLGKLELLKLRDDYRRVAGSHFSLQAFHDELLAHGDPPIAIARKIVLGAEDDGKLLPSSGT
jgi:uncharacterized protein (DUF885 family)